MAAQIWWDIDNAMKDLYAYLIAQSCVETATVTSSLGTGIRRNYVGTLLTIRNEERTYLTYSQITRQLVSVCSPLSTFL